VTAYLIASGSALPERVVSNEELAPQLGLAPEQIFKSSGIKERRWADHTTSTSQLAAAALDKAIDEAGITPADVDYLIFGTMTPDRFVPGSGPAVQKSLGLREVPCLDRSGRHQYFETLVLDIACIDRLRACAALNRSVEGQDLVERILFIPCHVEAQPVVEEADIGSKFQFAGAFGDQIRIPYA